MPGSVKKYFTVSYDDGLEQDKRLIELMKKYGIKGTFNLNSNLFGKRQNIEYIGSVGFKEVPVDVVKAGLFVKTAPHYRIPEDEICQVYEGFEIASHGANHVREGKLSSKEMEAEVCLDRNVLQGYSSLPVVGHVLPFGDGSEKLIKLLKEKNFQYVRLLNMSYKGKPNFSFPKDQFSFEPTCWHVDKHLLRTVDRFLQAPLEGEDQLFYMWGHGYELDFKLGFDLWERLEIVFDKISGHNDVVCCTNAEAMAVCNKK